MSLANIRDFILTYGWIFLIIGSLYIFIKGRHVYKLVRGSLLGRIIKALVYSVIVDLSSLGIVFVIFMFTRPKEANLLFPVFVIWFVIFVWTLMTLRKADNEARKIIEAGPNVNTDKANRPKK